MQTIAIVSAGGGAGRTMLTATLAGLLAARGRKVLAIDLDPRNNLGLHLGLPLDEADGLAPQLLAGGSWHQAAFQNSDGVRVLPFGVLAPERLPLLEGALLKSPHWLGEQLAHLALDDDTVVLIDTPRLPSQYAQQAIAAAELTLAVLCPDASAPVTARQVEQHAAGHPVYHVLNQLDATRTLQRDVLQLLREQLGTRVAPYPIHRDQTVPEAVASNRSLTAYAPHGQAAHDCQGLANWLLERLAARSPA